MSHIHNIDGYTNPAAQYQDYLDRLRLAREAERDDEIRKKQPTKSFDSMIDAEEKSAEEDGGEPQDEAGNHGNSDPDTESGTRYA